MMPRKSCSILLRHKLRKTSTKLGSCNHRACKWPSTWCDQTTCRANSIRLSHSKFASFAAPISGGARDWCRKWSTQMWSVNEVSQTQKRRKRPIKRNKNVGRKLWKCHMIRTWNDLEVRHKWGFRMEGVDGMSWRAVRRMLKRQKSVLSGAFVYILDDGN